MRPGRIVPWIVVAAVILLCPAERLSADTVLLANGDRLTGEVGNLEDGKLSLKTDYAGTIKISWGQVTDIETERQFEVETQSGRTYSGPLTRSEGEVVIGGEPEAVRVAPVDVVGLVAMSDGRPPSFWQRLQGNVDVGYSFNRGNSELTQSSLGIRANYRRPQYKLEGRVSSIFSSQEDAPTTSRQAANARYDRYLGPRALLFLLSSAERNDRQQLNLRTNTGGGLGWRLKKTDKTELSIRGGVTFTNERFQDGVETSSGEGLGAIEWQTVFFDRIGFTTDFKYLPSLTENGRYRLEYDSTMRVDLLGQLNWSLSLFDRFDSDPPLAVERNDYGLVSAFGFSF